MWSGDFHGIFDIASISQHPQQNPLSHISVKGHEIVFSGNVGAPCSAVPAGASAALLEGWLQSRLQKLSPGRPLQRKAGQPRHRPLLKAPSQQTPPHLHLDNGLVHSSDAKTPQYHLSGIQLRAFVHQRVR